jgi:hypothetical protein
MEKGKVVQNMHFEHMLWQNELEFNRRELAIFGNGLYGLISLYWCHATYSSDPVPPLR